MNTQKDLYSSNEEELLIEIGKALNEDSIGAFPKPLIVLQNEAEDYVNRNLERFRDQVCSSKAVQELASRGFTTELVSIVIGLLETATTKTAVSPLAILLCRRGIYLLCKHRWDHSKHLSMDNN